jgi:hypothetical protein
VDRLHELGIISEAERDRYLLRGDRLNQTWRAAIRSHRPPGRPRKILALVPAICSRPGCTQPAALGQKYCSRAHAPLADYGLRNDGSEDRSAKFY